MTSTFAYGAAALIAGLTVSVALAQTIGDSAKGQSYARTVCAECHAVEKAQGQSPNPKAPAFATVANTSGMTEMALRVWLQTSHPTMPNIVLGMEERDNVVAYIRSLKAPAP